MKLLPNKTYKKKGFTIVETLVAITILMISVAGPLVVATKGLNTALYSKNQMIASYLAQESMEVIKSTRYRNILTLSEDDWLKNLKDADHCYDEDHRCDASAFDDLVNSLAPDCPVSVPDVPKGCRMYYHPDFGYHNSDVDPDTATPFYRSFYIETIATTEFTNAEATVHVFVDWKEGTIPYQIHLSSGIVAATR